MTIKNSIALAWLVGCAVLAALWGKMGGHPQIVDFRVIYTGTHSLLQGHDPYQQAVFLRTFQDEGGVLPSNPFELREFQDLARFIYFPQTFLFAAPFALLPWKTAYLAWTSLIELAFVLAAYLMWKLAGHSTPVLAAGLLGFMLANSEILFAGGNAAGLAVSLCTIAIWCFIRERLIYVGVLSLAASLALKPHDAGFVWLFLLLAGGVLRKRALQALGVLIVLCVPSILWVLHVAPDWASEMRSNLAQVEVRGGLSDPGPSGLSAQTPVGVIDLQADLSTFRDDPHFYNWLAYVIFASLVALWIFVTVRRNLSNDQIWLGLAAAVPLTFLATYHRPHDAKLLILTIPACSLLWARGGWTRWAGSVLTAAAIVANSDIPEAILFRIDKSLQFTSSSWSGKLATIALVRPAPIALLMMAVFYLWIYASSRKKTIEPDNTETQP